MPTLPGTGFEAELAPIWHSNAASGAWLVADHCAPDRSRFLVS